MTCTSVLLKTCTFSSQKPLHYLESFLFSLFSSSAMHISISGTLVYLLLLFRWFEFTVIAQGTGNFDWQFKTLPFGNFLSNLDTRDLKAHPRTHFGHLYMSLSDGSRTV